jgi:sugar phosphate isomerase/epimerase
VDRRQALATLASAAALGFARGTGAAARRRVARVGLQLYTVRGLLGRDVAGTLDAVAAAGYAEVETAGYANLDPARFAAALRNAGLAAPSAHLRLQEVEDPRSLEAASVLGHRFLVIPVPDFRATGSLDDYRRLAERLNTAGARCAGAGIQLAYHNHDFEFAAIDGMRPFDLLLARCDPGLVKFELDLYWATRSGADPAALLRAAPQRYPLCHVKDMRPGGEMATVGDGAIDFAALFAAGSALEHWFVEHDNPADPLDCIRRGIVAVQALEY